MFIFHSHYPRVSAFICIIGISIARTINRINPPIKIVITGSSRDSKTDRLDSISDRLPRALSIVSNNKRSLLLQTSAGLRPQVLKFKLVERTELINRFVKNIKSNMKIKIQHHQIALEGLERIRQTLGYEATLRRGYTVVRNKDGKLITRLKEADVNKELEIEFYDGKTSLFK